MGMALSRKARPLVLVSIAAILLAIITATLFHRLRVLRIDSEPMNIVLIVMDTVSALHMADYGYDRVTTPELDRLAKTGLIFRNSFAAAPWTLPSHASIFTGLYPIVHGLTQENLKLGKEFPTLAELLRDNGYRTFAAVNNGAMNKTTRLQRGFSTYHEMHLSKVRLRFKEKGRHPTNLAVERFLDSIEADEPYFIFLNYMEAHGPYQPPDKYARKFLREGWTPRSAAKVENAPFRYYTGVREYSAEEQAVLSDLYDAELAGLSATIGNLVDQLDRRGELDRTLVIITSDHGQNHGEHGHFSHTFCLYDSLLRVPLIVLGGGLQGGVTRDDPVVGTDLFYMILSAAGIKAPPGRHGRDFLAPGAERATSSETLAEFYYPQLTLKMMVRSNSKYEDADYARVSPYLRRLRSINTGEWKLIWGSDGRHELYHVSEDPLEERDLADEEPKRVEALTQKLLLRFQDLSGKDLDWITDHPDERLAPSGFENVSDETRKELKALGYLP